MENILIEFAITVMITVRIAKFPVDLFLKFVINWEPLPRMTKLLYFNYKLLTEAILKYLAYNSEQFDIRRQKILLKKLKIILSWYFFQIHSSFKYKQRIMILSDKYIFKFVILRHFTIHKKSSCFSKTSDK